MNNCEGLLRRYAPRNDHLPSLRGVKPRSNPKEFSEIATVAQATSQRQKGRVNTVSFYYKLSIYELTKWGIVRYNM